MIVREVMTCGVAKISPQASVQDAAEQMRTLDIGSLPVCSSNELLGMVTDRDIAVRAVAAGWNPKTTKVADVMTPGMACCFEDDTIERAAKMMEKRQIRRLLVIDHRERPIGIVSLGDLARHTHGFGLSGEVLECVSEPLRPTPLV